MTRLPFEILLMIFEKIGFINLIKLRSICKDWKSIIDNNKLIKELTIDDEYSQFKILNNNSIIFLDQFKLSDYKIFEKIISSNILHNLKYLNYSFRYNCKNKGKLINLNCFKLLEHLVLKIELREKYKNLILVHPNIKILSVSAYHKYFHNYYGFYMEINCPKCENLEIGGTIKMEDYDIIYPERIRIFNLAIYDYDEYEIDKFINIEQLEIDTEFFDYDNSIICKISKFSKLKKIKIKFNESFISSTGRKGRQLYDSIDQILKEQIQIFLNDEEIKSKEQIKKLIDNDLFI